jgi:predicted GNAT family N-acyltransferase
MNAPIYSDRWKRSRPTGPATRQRATIKIARTLEDLMQVVAVRSAVFLTDQACPYEEEFDGNDFCSLHFIAMVGREPVAALRARYFGDFCKLERLAVRQDFRRSRIAFQIVQAGIEHARKKGFRRIYGHAQDRLVDFWAHFGAKPLPKNHKLVFSDFSYTEMVIELEPHPEPITMDSDPYLIIRPEGDWEDRGVLDESAARPATTPLNGRREAPPEAKTAA